MPERRCYRLWLARRNANSVYRQPDDVQTGEYGDDQFDDEFFWASVELYLSDAPAVDVETVVARAVPMTVPSWASVGALGYLSLDAYRDALPKELRRMSETVLQDFADDLVTRRATSAYGIAYGTDIRDFHWGGNSTALNQSMLLLRAYATDGNREYLDAAVANVDYVLGRNATGYSFVTGFGQRYPRHIHHRVSEADGIDDPVPGFLVGGPNTNGQDGCSYPSEFPARFYVDDWCSYTTNEVTINWNAPLVYVASALHVLESARTTVPNTDTQ